MGKKKIVSKARIEFEEVKPLASAKMMKEVLINGISYWDLVFL